MPDRGERPLTERFATTSDGLRLAYRLVGPASGVPVVLCHGLGAGGIQFAADAEAFAALGYRVLVPDLRGHGASRLPETPGPEDFSIARLVADMREVLDHTGLGPVHWVGNSLGGILGLTLAAEAPGRLRSLATFGTAHRLDLPAYTGPALGLILRVFGARLTAWTTALAATRHGPARPVIARMLAEADPRAMVGIAEAVRRYDLTETALGFAGPQLLLRGGGDIAVNRALAASLPRFAGHPGFTLVDLPKAGHCANLDAGESWRAALLAFWRGPEDGRREDRK